MTSARQDAERDVFRFYAICGISCYTPSIEIDIVESCFPSAKVQPIEGSGDVTFGDEQLRLQEDAIEFAEKYNLMMAILMRSRRLSVC